MEKSSKWSRVGRVAAKAGVVVCGLAVTGVGALFEAKGMSSYKSTLSEVGAGFIMAAGLTTIAQGFDVSLINGTADRLRSWYDATLGTLAVENSEPEVIET